MYEGDFGKTLTAEHFGLVGSANVKDLNVLAD
jgi:hypothetical protein